jgi:hypothetical protein
MKENVGCICFHNIYWFISITIRPFSLQQDAKKIWPLADWVSCIGHNKLKSYLSSFCWFSAH